MGRPLLAGGNCCGGAREREELNLEGAHLPCSKIKKHPFHLPGFQGESIPSPKQQVPEFHSPRPWEFTSPLQRIPQSPITWFFRTSQRLSLLSSSFGHRKSLLGRGLERTLQVQTLLMSFVTLSILCTTALTSPVKASTFSYLISFSATRVGSLVASTSSFRTSHLWQNSLSLNKYLKHTVEKEKPFRPFPHPTYLK